jgi:hypothetical protein
MGFASILLTLFCLAEVHAQDTLIKTRRNLLLGDTPIAINVYEKKGSLVTFVIPHHNEQVAIKTTKEAIERNGGRLVEIESLDESGAPIRRLRFNLKGAAYSVDPNRIYTENGRQCSGLPTEVNIAVKTFAEELLKIILLPIDGNPAVTKAPLVAVHNNSDVGDKSVSERFADLTATAFVRNGWSQDLPHGSFADQAAGVFLSNSEPDEDNFVILSTTKYLGAFAERGFNAVVQKPVAELWDKKCSVDDGSLSVYSAQQNIEYICLEADIKGGAFRQRQMLETVYRLVQQISPEIKTPEPDKQNTGPDTQLKTHTSVATLPARPGTSGN